MTFLQKSAVSWASDWLNTLNNPSIYLGLAIPYGAFLCRYSHGAYFLPQNILTNNTNPCLVKYFTPWIPIIAS